MCNKHLSAKQSTWSSTAIVHDCSMPHINNTAPILLGDQTHATFHEKSIEDDIVKSEYSMPMTVHFALCNYSCPEIVFTLLPKQPPNGIIMAFIILVFIGSIFSAMAMQYKHASMLVSTLLEVFSGCN